MWGAAAAALFSCCRLLLFDFSFTWLFLCVTFIACFYGVFVQNTKFLWFSFWLWFIWFQQRVFCGNDWQKEKWFRESPHKKVHIKRQNFLVSKTIKRELNQDTTHKHTEVYNSGQTARCLNVNYSLSFALVAPQKPICDDTKTSPNTLV